MGEADFVKCLMHKEASGSKCLLYPSGKEAWKRELHMQSPRGGRGSEGVGI